MSRQFSGKNLRAHRVAAGVKVEQIALHIDRSSHAVMGYELGRAAPQAANLAKIADMLDISIDDLFEEQAVAA